MEWLPVTEVKQPSTLLCNQLRWLCILTILFLPCRDSGGPRAGCVWADGAGVTVNKRPENMSVSEMRDSYRSIQVCSPSGEVHGDGPELWSLGNQTPTSDSRVGFR